jgi:hypothetical protein
VLNTNSEKSHNPKDWTLKASNPSMELREDMKVLNFSRFILPGKGHQNYRIDTLDTPEIYNYLSERVIEAATGMSGPVNGPSSDSEDQAAQFKDYTSSVQGFQGWLSQLQRDVNFERREEAFRMYAEALRRQLADEARADSNTVTLSTESLIQRLLQDTELLSSVMDVVMANATLNEQLSARLMQEQASGHACDSKGLQFAGMSLRTLEQLPGVKHKSMLVKLVQASANPLSDFASMLGAKDLRAVSLPEPGPEDSVQC